MAVVCDDLWPVISDVSFVTNGRSLDLLIYKTWGGVIRFWQLSGTCNFVFMERIISNEMMMCQN